MAVKSNFLSVTSSPITVSGTASDPGSPSSGLALVEVRVNGGSWQTATGTTNWNRLISLTSGSNSIEARSRDNAGNYSTTASVTVTYNPADTTLPTVAISSPTGGQTVTSSQITVSGTASDPGSSSSGLALVEVRVNGGSWQTTTGTTTWNRSISLTSGSNSIEARSRDNAGNYSTTASVTVTYTPPDDLWKSPTVTGTMNLADDWANPENAFSDSDNGAYTNSAGSLTAQDYGHFNFNIPNEAVIDGIEVQIKGHGDANTKSSNKVNVVLWSASSEDTGSKFAYFDPDSDSTETLGGPTDKWEGWITNWAASDFDNDKFWLKIRTYNGSEKQYIDYIKVRVYYTEVASNPSVGFATTDLSGSEALSTGTLTANLSSASTQTVTVNYSVNGGSATDGGVDYTLASGTLTFAPSVTTQTISIPIVNDALYESTETIVVSLDSAQNAQLGANTLCSYAIINDDPLPVASFAQAASSGDESTSPAQLAVTLSAVSGVETKVNYAATDGTAQGSGVDYTLNSGTLTFAPGETSKSIPVTIVSDSISDDGEDFTVTLSSPDGCELGTPSIHTRTITDGITDRGTLHIDTNGDTAGIQATRSTAGISMGSNIAIQVWAKDVEDLKGVTGDFTFDPTCWACQGVVEGPFLASAGGTTFFQGEIDNSSGVVAINGAVMGPNPANSPDGEGVLATLTLKLLKKQENTITAVSPTFVEIASGNDSQYTPQVVSGSFVIGPESDFVGQGSSSPDGYVDFWDLLYFANNWHTRSTDTGWDKRCDLDKDDDYVDFWDLLVFAEQWHTGEKP